MIGLDSEASGWGTLFSGGSIPNDLYAVEMPIVGQSNSQYVGDSLYNDFLMVIAGNTVGKLISGLILKSFLKNERYKFFNNR